MTRTPNWTVWPKARPADGGQRATRRSITPGKKLPNELSSHGGLALVGHLFKRINLPAMADTNLMKANEAR
jgi:hypothetical protein